MINKLKSRLIFGYSGFISHEWFSIAWGWTYTHAHTKTFWTKTICSRHAGLEFLNHNLGPQIDTFTAKVRTLVEILLNKTHDSELQGQEELKQPHLYGYPIIQY